MKIFSLTIINLLIAISLQYPSYKIQYPYLLKEQDIPIKCMKINEVQLNVKRDYDNYYLCIQKEYLWLVEHFNITFQKNPFELSCQTNDEIIQKYKSTSSKPTIIIAEQQDHKINMTYFSLSMQQDEGIILFTKVTPPQNLQPYSKQIQSLIYDQVELGQSHEAGKSLLKNALILITILAILVCGAYWWKQKQMDSPIDKQPADLQEAMLSKWELQAEQERRKFSSSNNLMRKSQPSHMIEMTTIHSPESKAQRIK